MQKVLFIILLNTSIVSNMNSEKIIKNVNIPSCRNCIFHKPNNNNNFASSSNLCEKFGEKNIITNEIDYDSVFACRIIEEKCGKEGKYFQEDPNINLKILKHYIIKNAYITCFLILLFYNSK